MIFGEPTPSNVQGLVLAQHSRIISGGTRGTLWDAGDQNLGQLYNLCPHGLLVFQKLVINHSLYLSGSDLSLPSAFPIFGFKYIQNMFLDICFFGFSSSRWISSLMIIIELGGRTI